MPEPITFDMPHTLGREKARERIAAGLDKLAGFVPGSTFSEHRWDGDTLTFVVQAVGQRVAAKLDVLDDRVHALIDLPPVLALFANKVREQLSAAGQKLLR